MQIHTLQVGQDTQDPSLHNLTFIHPAPDLPAHIGIIRLSIEEIFGDGIGATTHAAYVTVDYAEDNLQEALETALRQLLSRRTDRLLAEVEAENEADPED